MELKDYCSNLSLKLTGWKAKAYDIYTGWIKSPQETRQK